MDKRNSTDADTGGGSSMPGPAHPEPASMQKWLYAAYASGAYVILFILFYIITVFMKQRRNKQSEMKSKEVTLEQQPHQQKKEVKQTPEPEEKNSKSRKSTIHVTLGSDYANATTTCGEKSKTADSIPKELLSGSRRANEQMKKSAGTTSTSARRRKREKENEWSVEDEETQEALTISVRDPNVEIVGTVRSHHPLIPYDVRTPSSARSPSGTYSSSSSTPSSSASGSSSSSTSSGSGSWTSSSSGNSSTGSPRSRSSSGSRSGTASTDESSSYSGSSSKSRNS